MDKQTKKILVRVWVPLVDALNKKMDALCLRRDPYLNKVIGQEAKMLDDELPKANSPDARNYIVKHLDQLDRRPISLTLDAEVVVLLDDVCARKKVVRDAFINRLFLFLVASPKLLDHIFRLEEDGYGKEVRKRFEGQFVANDGRSKPLDAAAEILLAPFQFIRECLEVAREDNPGVADLTFHQLYIREKVFKDAPSLLGLNCFIEDDQIEGHPSRQSLEDLLNDI